MIPSEMTLIFNAPQSQFFKLVSLAAVDYSLDLAVLEVEFLLAPRVSTL